MMSEVRTGEQVGVEIANAIDPLACVSELLYRKAHESGIVEIEVELQDDGGWYSIPLDQAFEPDCLLPALLVQIETVYEQMWMDRVGFAFPFDCVPDTNAVFGARVVWVDSGAPTKLAVVCALDVLGTMTAANPGGSILKIEMAA